MPQAIEDIDSRLKPTVARNMLNCDVWMIVEFENADKLPRIIECGMTSKRLWALSELLKKEGDRRLHKSVAETESRR